MKIKRSPQKENEKKKRQALYSFGDILQSENCILKKKNEMRE